MKRSLLTAIIIFSVVICGLALPDISHAKDNQNAVTFGGVANIVGSVILVEYERVVADKVSIAARLGNFSYEVEYDEGVGTTTESGDGPGAEGVFRFYPGGGLNGFYIGGALGVWSVDWDWEWKATGYATEKGSGSSTTVDLNFTLGGKINLGSDRVYIDPSFTVGNFFAETHGKTGESDEIGLYAAIGLGIGITF